MDRESNIGDIYRKSFAHYAEMYKAEKISEPYYEDVILHLTAMYMAAKADMSKEQLEKLLEVLA